MNKSNEYRWSLSPRIVSLTDWLEDYPNLFVQIIRNPEGIGYPDKAFPKTVLHVIREVVQIGDLNQIIKRYIGENIWRSWHVFSDSTCSNAISCNPIVIDIDNEEYNLENAYALTRDCIFVLEEIIQQARPDRFRIIFSGRKGFHIEIKPAEPVDNQYVREELLRRLIEMGQEPIDAKNQFSIGVVDTCKDFIRLTDSFYSWEEDNTIKKRKIIQLSSEDFGRLQVEDILRKSETA